MISTGSKDWFLKTWNAALIRALGQTFKYADVEDLELGKVRVGIAIIRHLSRGLEKDIPPVRHTRKRVLERSKPMLEGTGSVAEGVSRCIVGITCVAHPYAEVVDSTWRGSPTACNHSRQYGHGPLQVDAHPSITVPTISRAHAGADEGIEVVIVGVVWIAKRRSSVVRRLGNRAWSGRAVPREIEHCMQGIRLSVLYPDPGYCKTICWSNPSAIPADLLGRASSAI